MNITGWEFILLIVLAVVILGPERLPEYAARLGRFVRQAKAMAESAKGQLREQMGPEFDDITGGSTTASTTPAGSCGRRCSTTRRSPRGTGPAPVSGARDPARLRPVGADAVRPRRHLTRGLRALVGMPCQLGVRVSGRWG